MKIFIGNLTFLLMMTIFSGCIAFRTYTPSINPAAIPRDSSSLSVGAGLPIFLEYRTQINSHLDLLVNGAYTPNSVVFAVGPNLWFWPKNSKPGFNCSVFFEPNISVNADASLNWSTYGGRLGFTPGYYGAHWNFSFPISAGGGGALNGTGGYFDGSGGIQIQYVWVRNSFGLDIGVAFGSGMSSWGHTLILLFPIPTLSLIYTHAFGNETKQNTEPVDKRIWR